MSNHLGNSIVFRFHYHSQCKVIGCLGLQIPKVIWTCSLLPLQKKVLSYHKTTWKMIHGTPRWSMGLGFGPSPWKLCRHVQPAVFGLHQGLSSGGHSVDRCTSTSSTPTFWFSSFKGLRCKPWPVVGEPSGAGKKREGETWWWRVLAPWLLGGDDPIPNPCGDDPIWLIADIFQMGWKLKRPTASGVVNEILHARVALLKPWVHSVGR